MAAITTLVNFNFANGEHPVGSLVEDAAGDLFGTAISQNSNGDDVVQVFEVAKTPGGYASAPTILGTIGNVSYLAPALTIDASGNLLVEANTYGFGGSEVYELAKSGDAYVAPTVIANVAGESSAKRRQPPRHRRELGQGDGRGRQPDARQRAGLGVWRL